MSADFQLYSINSNLSPTATSSPTKTNMDIPTEALEKLAVSNNATTTPVSKTAGKEVVEDPKSEEKLKAISLESVVPEVPASKIEDPKLSEVSKLTKEETLRLNQGFSSSASNTKYQESDEEFFSRLKEQFETTSYNNKSKDLFAKALCKYFGNVKPGNTLQKRKAAELIFEAIRILKKPKVVRNLVNTLNEFKDLQLQDLINEVRDILRYENEQENGSIGMPIVNKLEASFNLVQVYHSSWQRARLFDVVYNTIQSISEIGISGGEVLTAFKALLAKYIQVDKSVDTTVVSSVEEANTNYTFSIFSENQIEKIKISLDELGDLELTHKYAICSRALFSRARNGPVEPETIFKAFDDLISYLESIGPENVHDPSVTGKEPSEFANITQLRKVGELISTKLITRVVDSVWQTSLIKEFNKVLDCAENFFSKFSQLAEIRADIHYGQDLIKEVIDEDAKDVQIDRAGLVAKDMLLETWCAAAPLVEEEGAHDSIDTTSGDVVVQKSCDLKKVTADAESVVKLLIPSEGEEQNKAKLKKKIELALKRRWKYCRLFVFGSSGNSYGSPSSDMDLCLRLKSADKSKACFQIRAALRQYGDGLGFDDIIVIAKARVPIVKFCELTHGIECDICVDNELAVHNTRLLKAYASLDPRVRAVGLFVKAWASKRGVKRSDSGTLSSYAWIILSIFYLQYIGMIPSLQQITPNDRQDKKKNILNTYESYDISFCQKGSKAWVAASNTAKQYNGSLGALVYGFFLFSRAYLARE